jgi:ribosomal protein S18 acetylase RimI-like enzyme
MAARRIYAPRQFSPVLFQTLPAPRRFTAAGFSQRIVNLGMDPPEAASRPFYLEEISATASEGTRAQARELLLEYGRFVVAQPGAARFCFASLEEEAALLPLSFLEQGGGCIMANAQGEPVGFIAWRALPAIVAPDCWELKRLWVRPAGRGLGLGRALTQAVLARAIAAQRKAVYLDTAPASMAAALRIYIELGFQPCAPYNDNPVEGLAYLVKTL